MSLTLWCNFYPMGPQINYLSPGKQVRPSVTTFPKFNQATGGKVEFYPVLKGLKDKKEEK